jgi:hypothetical protein
MKLPPTRQFSLRRCHNIIAKIRTEFHSKSGICAYEFSNIKGFCFDTFYQRYCGMYPKYAKVLKEEGAVRIENNKKQV